jgi:hypothetical protein
LQTAEGTWHLTLRAGCGLRVSKNIVVKPFIDWGCEENVCTKTEEMAEGCRELRKEMVHNLYWLYNVMMIQARSLRWVGFVACNRDHTKQNKD